MCLHELFVLFVGFVPFEHRLEVYMQTFELGETLLTKESLRLRVHLTHVLGWQVLFLDYLGPVADAVLHEG